MNEKDLVFHYSTVDNNGDNDNNNDNCNNNDDNDNSNNNNNDANNNNDNNKNNYDDKIIIDGNNQHKNNDNSNNKITPHNIIPNSTKTPRKKEPQKGSVSTAFYGVKDFVHFAGNNGVGGADGIYGPRCARNYVDEFMNNNDNSYNKSNNDNNNDNNTNKIDNDSNNNMNVESLMKITVSHKIFHLLSSHHSYSSSHHPPPSSSSHVHHSNLSPLILIFPFDLVKLIEGRYEMIGPDIGYPPLTQDEMYIRTKLKEYVQSYSQGL